MCFTRIANWLKKILGGKQTVPALANTFLFVEPDDNYLNYGSSVLAMLVAQNRKPSQSVTEIKGVDATTANVKSQITALNPMVFVAIGHGNTTTYTVEAEEIFMQVGGSTEGNISLMKDRVVHLNSCETAVTLGPAIVSAGAVAYVGSSWDFNFFVRDGPNASRATQTPFLAEYQFDVSLLNGKSVADARADMLAKYDSEVAYWVSGDGKGDPDASELAAMLLGNKQLSTILGAGGATTPSPSGAVGAMQLPPEIAVPASFVGALAVAWYLFGR